MKILAKNPIRFVWVFLGVFFLAACSPAQSDPTAMLDEEEQIQHLATSTKAAATSR